MTIHQDVTIAASPAAIYEVLTGSEKFTGMSGGRAATISREPGGAFSLFGGGISGRNIELVPGKRVVQAWRAGNWPEGLYSLIRFELTPAGKGTRIVFDQIGHPPEGAPMLDKGWHENYWQPLTALLAGK